MPVRVSHVCGAVLLVALAACGGGKAKAKKVAAPPPTTTSSTIPQPAIDVAPASGPVGTKFSLTARNFAAGDTLTFEVDFPGGRKFNGQPHTVAADGTVSTIFIVSSVNPQGAYVVKATATKGQTAQAQFTVGPATATSTTAAPGATASTLAPAKTTSTTRKAG